MFYILWPNVLQIAANTAGKLDIICGESELMRKDIVSQDEEQLKVVDRDLDSEIYSTIDTTNAIDGDYTLAE